MKHQTWGGLIQHLVRSQKLIACTCKPEAHCNKQKHDDPACPRGNYVESVRSIRELLSREMQDMQAMRERLVVYDTEIGVIRKLLADCGLTELPRVAESNKVN